MVRKPQNSRGDGRAVVHRHRAFVWQCDGAQCGFPWGAVFFPWMLLLRAAGCPCKHAHPCTRSFVQTRRRTCAVPVGTSLHAGGISL